MFTPMSMLDDKGTWSLNKFSRRAATFNRTLLKRYSQSRTLEITNLENQIVKVTVSSFPRQFV